MTGVRQAGRAVRGRGVSEGGPAACLPFQSFPPGRNKSKEETEREERAG